MNRFALFRGGIVTANSDGSIGINAKVGEAVDQACVDQANLAPELLEALQELVALERSDKVGAEYKRAMYAALGKAEAVIAKATSAQRSAS